MYKMYKEGESYSIDLVDKENLEYEGFIRDKKIEQIIEVGFGWIKSHVKIGGEVSKRQRL